LPPWLHTIGKRWYVSYTVPCVADSTPPRAKPACPPWSSDFIPKTPKPTITAGQIAEMATRGEDVSRHFTNKVKVARPVQRVNVDLTQAMLRQLE
jgi:hypothetical protein